MAMRACRWRIGCICRTPGPRMMTAAPRQGCPRRSRSRPSRRLRSNRSAGRARSVFLATWRWWTPATISVKDLALGLRNSAWRTIQWREGTNEWLSSRFARMRVHVASGHERPGEPTKEWLLIEWPEGEKEPTKYWLSTLPSSITFRDLVDAAKLRWRIERDYQELKQEVGLGHYEGRGWRGFHHHATMCIAAYGFLVSERETIPPSGPRVAARFSQLAVPERYRPRGSPVAP